MGLIPDSPVEEQSLELPSRGGRDPAAALRDNVQAPAALRLTGPQPIVHRETTSIPWFDSIVEGSRLGGRLRTVKGTRQSVDGTTKVEWEISEYNDDGDEETSTPSGNNGKRKLGDRDDIDDDRMDGLSQQ